jgi:Fe-S-cluster containining protein
MSQKEIIKSLELLEEDWDIDPIIKDFHLGRRDDVSENSIKVGGVVFHIPFLKKIEKFILWKCFWPDCSNCCTRQGRLPLTSNDLITIGSGMKYKKTSDFIKNETVIATWQESSPDGGSTTLTSINLKRKENETEADDGTHIKCRFLDEEGSCSIHPTRPGVCFLYPFSTWQQNEKGMVRIHATFQFTGDCPGFYLDDSIDTMKETLQEYSEIIYDYNLKSSGTMREGLGSISLG